MLNYIYHKMLEDIIGAAANLFNTPGVVMMGVGVFSAMVLRSLVSQANKSSTAFISYQTESDEFPLPVPPSIYYMDESENEKLSQSKRILPRCIEKQSTTENKRSFSPKERCSTPPAKTNAIKTPVEHNMMNDRNEGESTGGPCIVPVFFKREITEENLADAQKSTQEVTFHNHYWRDHPEETVFCLPKPTNIEENLYNIQESSSDPGAGDSYLIVEPPEDSSESNNQTAHSVSEGHAVDSSTLSSFTGPFLVQMNVDDSTSESVTWTEAFVEREPFDHKVEEKVNDMKS